MAEVMGGTQSLHANSCDEVRGRGTERGETGRVCVRISERDCEWGK